MLILLSPAKSLDYETPAPLELPSSKHAFAAESKVLIALLRTKTWPEVAELMSLSEPLAQLNVARYAAYSSRFTAKNAKQAVLAFNGDVYDGLAARSLAAEDLAWAQAHLRHLSGLYGVLRPFDAMQPYRLEMGTRLANPEGSNLYAFWGAKIARRLRTDLAASVRAGGADCVLNLASEEYFKAVDLKALQKPVVSCAFEDAATQAGPYKVVSFFAKRARGMMARHCITQRISAPQDVLGFSEGGYKYAKALSTPERLVFRRVSPKP